MNKTLKKKSITRIVKSNLTVPKVIKESLSKTKTKSDVDDFPLKHISASSMILMSTNPILAKIKYLNGDIFETTSGISGILGKAFHTAMCVYYGGSDTLIASNESESIEYGLKAGMEFIQKYNDGFINYSKTIPNKQKALELLSFCFKSYISEFPYIDNVVALEEKIEEKIEVDWRGKKIKLPVKLKGYLDKIERNKDGKIVIRDYKTCYSFSDLNKIDGAKILQAVEYYFLAYAKFGEEPYSIIFDEVKYSKNKDKKEKQVRSYEIIFAENDLYFDFYLRFYEDFIRAVNGEMVYFPNVHARYDNEVAIIAYIHRLDVSEEIAKLMKKHKVDRISDLLKKEIQSAGNMRKLLKSVEENFVSVKNINYEKMVMEEKIQTKLLEYGIMLQFDSKVEGTTVDLYRYVPSMGIKMSRLKAYAEDIEQVIGITGVRILAPIPNSSLVGFEIPRAERIFPGLPAFKKTFNLMIGQTVNGDSYTFDFREAPHMLVAGSSGSGKSVFLHSLIAQFLKLPKVKLYLCDPKQVEFSCYDEQVEEYKHSQAGIVSILESLVEEMEERYSAMKKAKARNIAEMPSMSYKVVIIDEYADLSIKGNVEQHIQLLAQKGRACGIHIILATQRASTKILNGDILVNFPTKVVFRVSKEVDSRVMLNEGGAEKLLGKGDMLFSTSSGTVRLQGYKI